MKFWPVIMLHVLSSIISWVMLSNPLTQLYALLIVLIYNSHALFNTKSHLPLPFSEIRTLFTEDWSQLYPPLPNIISVCTCMCAYLFIYFSILSSYVYKMHVWSSPACFQPAFFMKFLVVYPWRIYVAGTRCKIKLKSPGALRSEAKCQVWYFLLQMGRRVLASLPILQWENLRSTRPKSCY